jgi:hypothetical protein
MKFVEIRVKVPDGNGYKDNPNLMKRVDEHVNMHCAIFKASKGLPIQEEDGTWELRVLNPSMASVIKGILTDHYGFEVVSAVTRD